MVSGESVDAKSLLCAVVNWLFDSVLPGGDDDDIENVDIFSFKDDVDSELN